MIYTKNFKQTLFVLDSEKDNYSEIQGWKKVQVNKGKIYNIKGLKYNFIEERMQHLPLLTIERIVKIAFAIICTTLTFGLALASETIRVCLTGRKVVIILKQETANTPEGLSKLVDSPYKPAKKFFDSPTIEKQSDFVPLSDQQVKHLISLEPKLKIYPSWNEKAIASQFILEVHQSGNTRAFLSHKEIEELKSAVQFIMYSINQEPDLEKKKELLLELAKCLEGCANNSVNATSDMCMKLKASEGFTLQAEFFILKYKDRIVDEVIYNLYPHTQNANHVQVYKDDANMQFGHLKTGFVALIGEELGLNTNGTKGDLLRNQGEASSKREKFKKLFLENISFETIIREFIIDVNGRNGQFNITELSKWCCPDNLGEEAHNIFYDESFEYPIYSPVYNKRYEYEPFLTEKTAYLIFKKLGYIATEE